MRIYTQMGEPVEVIDFTETTNMGREQYVTLRSRNDPSWVFQRRMYELKADGGIQEILKAVEELQK